MLMAVLSKAITDIKMIFNILLDLVSSYLRFCGQGPQIKIKVNFSCIFTIINFKILSRTISVNIKCTEDC